MNNLAVSQPPEGEEPIPDQEEAPPIEQMTPGHHQPGILSLPLVPGGNALTQAQRIRAFHGSPHDFSQFDTSKIGTGEGAQSYGHGLYFAENPAVAESYRITTTGKLNDIDRSKLGKLKKWQSDDLDDLTTMMNHRGMTLDEAIAAKRASHTSGLDWQKNAADELEDYRSTGSQYADIPTFVAQRQKDWQLQAKQSQRSLDWLNETEGKLSAGRAGHHYEVAIDAHPDEFLDLDKTLSAQSKHVSSALERMVRSKPGADDLVWQHPNDPYQEMNLSDLKEGPERDVAERTLRKVGGKIQARWQHEMDRVGPQKMVFGNGSPEDRVAQSQALHAAGIKGIRYLDQGSRGRPAEEEIAKDVADWEAAPPSPVRDQRLALARQKLADLKAKPGTHNYVIFDPKIVSILKKNGIDVLRGNDHLDEDTK